MGTKRCVACARDKNVPEAEAAWDQQWNRDSANRDFLAQQQKVLDDIYAEKASMQRMKEQAE